MLSSLPCELWAHIASFLPLRDRETLLETCAETREGVIFLCECARTRLLARRGYFFENEYGLPCVDEEEVGFYARALLRHTSALSTTKRDAAAKFCAAMTAAFSDALDDPDFEMTENERVDRVSRMMKVASAELSHRCRGKAVGLFLRYEIDDLETAIGVGELGLVEHELFDMNEDKEERIKYERASLRSYLRVFIVTHVVLGSETLSHLYTESSHRYDLEAAFAWKAFTIGFMGLLTTRESTSAELLRTLTMPNVRWFLLNLYKNGTAHATTTNASETHSILDSIADLYSKSIDIEIATFRQYEVDSLTGMTALQRAEQMFTVVHERVHPNEVFNDNIAALAKILSLIVRETNQDKTSFARVVFDLTRGWDASFKLMLLGSLWEACPQTDYLLRALLRRDFVPAPFDQDDGGLGIMDVQATRVGRKLLAVFEQRHHVRLKPDTCVSLFELARKNWTEEDDERMVRSLLKDCNVGVSLSLTACSYECCRNGINDNVLALVVFLAERGVARSKRVSSFDEPAPKRRRVVKLGEEDASNEESLLYLDFEYEVGVFSQRESPESQDLTPEWLAREE